LKFGKDILYIIELIALAFVWFYFWWFLIPAIVIGLLAFAYVMKRIGFHKAKGDYEQWKKKPLTRLRSIFAFAYDFIVLNVLVGSLIFLRIPQEFLLTTRLKEILVNAGNADWRYKQAKVICGWLEYFDSQHCQ
jgi:uncharacterized protein YqhQ